MSNTANAALTPHHYNYYCRYEGDTLPFQPLVAEHPSSSSSCWRCCDQDSADPIIPDTRPDFIVLNQNRITGRIVIYDDKTHRFRSKIITLDANQVFIRW